MKVVNNMLMVCLGNICRSPVAEGIMRSKLEAKKLNVLVDSAGTSSYHIDENPDQRSIKNAAQNGIDISKLKARQFVVEDFDNFDIIFVMDEQNKKDVLSLSRNENDKAKVRLMLTELNSQEHINVPDPYFGGEVGFQVVFDLLNNACDSFVNKLSNQLNPIKQ